ncbi:MAG: hypothetical protein KJO12_10205 [Ignavibacteria bacterium]|nr:hypothetical protein [Ignavibacteria bacterium]
MKMVLYKAINTKTGEEYVGESSCTYEKLEVAEKARRNLVRTYSPAAKFYIKEILKADGTKDTTKTTALDNACVAEQPVI